MQCRKPPLPALTVKLSKYNVDDVALGVCKTGAEEAGVTEVRTSLSEKKFELWRDISNVVTDAASGVVDIFHGIDKAVADTWNNFWKDGKADGIGSNLSRK